MPEAKPQSTRSAWPWITALISVAALLAPWLRNREFIRDFFDYGLMITTSGRINGGELPFVDFASVLQTGSYWLNAGAERLWGPTFQSLTLANGVFIVVAWGGLTLLIRKTIPVVPAMMLAAVLVAGSACQHTIIWYNAIGVVALAGAAIGAAIAPVISRDRVGINLLVVAALVLGGINKINFHAIALVAAVAWTVRAGLLGHHHWTAVARTLMVWLFAGLALPILIELLVTGASWQQWKTNVITLPFSERSDYLSSLLTVEFYLRPMHDYYGPVIRPAGLIIALWALISMLLAWRGRHPLDRLSLVGAALFVVFATGGLMATNHEIIYVSLAAGIAMLISYWAGTGLNKQPRLLTFGLVLPSVIFGLVMLHSGWLGQRSQFGHSEAPREAYQDIGREDDVFSYLKGTKIPPALAKSLLDLRAVLPPADANGIHSCFYATGAEFLERFWPNENIDKMPLLLASLTLGPAQSNDLIQAFDYPPKFRMLVGMEAWTGSWPGDLHLKVQRNSEGWEVGLFTVHRFTGDWLQRGLPPIDNALSALNSFGGNMDPTKITVGEPLWPLESPSGRSYIGTFQQRGSFTFTLPSFRVNGEIALHRSRQAKHRPLQATFSVFDATVPEESMGALIWTETHELEAHEEFKSVEYHLDSRGKPIRFVVEVDGQSLGDLRAGFFLPRIGHSDPTPSPAPLLRNPSPPEYPDSEALKAALVPAEWRKGFEVLARDATIDESGSLIVAQGGELWLKPTRPIHELHGKISLTAPPDQSGAPVARVVWYRGGRMEVQMQAGISPERSIPFKSWPAEDDGWYGILLDSSHNPHGLKIELTSIVPR